MGFCIQAIKGAGPVMESKTKIDLDHGFVWVIGRRAPKDDPNKNPDWHLQGVASEEEIAIGMCVDENYFVGPLPLDVALPYKTIEWAGLYFPLGPNFHNTAG